jgi:hypothetical protein
MAKTEDQKTNAYRLSPDARRKVQRGLLLVRAFYALMIALIVGCLAVAGVLGYMAVDLAKEHRTLWVAGALGIATVCVLVGAYYLSATVVLVLKRFPENEPAVWVNFQREPELTSFLTALSKDMGVPVAENVVLHADARCFATRYPTNVLNAKLHGSILCIGLPLLSVLTVNELRAAVARELAHLSGEEEKYNARVKPFHKSIAQAGTLILDFRARRRFNVLARVLLRVPLLILRVFDRLLERLDKDLSIPFEKRVDAIAAAVCGKNTVVSAIRKNVGYESAFFVSFTHIMQELEESTEPDVNLYRTFRMRLGDYKPLAQQKLDSVMMESAGEGESQPNLGRRLEEIPPRPERYNDLRPALALFKQYAGYESLAHRHMFNELKPIYTMRRKTLEAIRGMNLGDE